MLFRSKLECSHQFHRACVEGQLRARWTGKRISFNYMNCAQCRQRIAHPEIDLSEHLAFREKVIGMCLKRALAEGGFEDVSKAHKVSREAAEELVVETMVAYECKKCSEPFCGGRIDCTTEEEIDADRLQCAPCLWESGPSERKCMEHGARFAIYKCDSCCSIATYDCSGNHFCDCCHAAPRARKNYPCPGPGKCPLGIPHPANTEGVVQQHYKAFVLGCSKCFANDEDPSRAATTSSVSIARF